MDVSRDHRLKARIPKLTRPVTPDCYQQTRLALLFDFFYELQTFIPTHIFLS
jgi:hypothetical protein